MSSQQKRKGGGGGAHGVDYQVEMVMLFFLKAYNAGTDFKISSEIEEHDKFDDVVLQSNKSNFYVQTKHFKNSEDKISSKKLLNEKKKWSLMTYLTSFKNICLGNLEEIYHDIQMLEENHLQIRDLQCICKNLIDVWKDISKDNLKGLLEEFIFQIERLQNSDLITKVNWFRDSNFYLITNGQPSCTMDSNFAAIGNFKQDDFLYSECDIFYYKFILEQMPAEFNINCASYFFEKFKLVVLPKVKLRKNIKLALQKLTMFTNIQWTTDLLCQIKHEINDWFIADKKDYMTPIKLECIFSDLLTSRYVNDLSKFQDKFNFEIDNLLPTIEKNNFILIKSPRYFLLMVKLQEKWLTQIEKGKMLFINPEENIELQICVIKSFKHPKYTHCVCPIIKQRNGNLKDKICEMFSQLDKRRYKKLIILCNDVLEFCQIPGVTIISDEKCYDNLRLKDRKRLQSLGELDAYYVPRLLHYGQDILSEEEFLTNIIKSKKKNSFITDGPGMGKTTLLRCLTCKLNKNLSLWAIYINLNDHTNLLNQHMKCNMPDVEDFFRFMSNISKKDIVERQISTIPKVVFLLIDAVDEVSPNYTKIVMDFLECTAKKVEKIIITSREYLKIQLCKSLKVEPFSLNVFKKQDQKKLLLNFWINQLERKSESVINKCENYCDQLLNYFEKSYNYSNVLGMPLLTMMVSEIFVRNIQSDSDEFFNDPKEHFCLPNNFCLAKLYELFINRKKEIYIAEKCRIKGNMIAETNLEQKFNDYLKVCQNFAIKTIFDKEDWHHFDVYAGLISKDVDDEQLFKTGLLTKTEVNCWLNEDLQNKIEFENIASESFVYQDDCYQKNDKLDEEDFNIYNNEINFVENFQLECMYSDDLSTKYFLNETDSDFIIGGDYKTEVRNIENISREGTEYFCMDEFKFIHRTFTEYFVAKVTWEKLLLYKNEMGLSFPTFVLTKIFLNPKNLVIQLFIEHYLRNNWSAINPELINTFSKILYETPSIAKKNLGYLADWEYYYILKLLLDGPNTYKWINEKFEGSYYNIAQRAWRHLNILQLLVDNGADLELKYNIFENTILHEAVEEGYLKIVEYIVGKVSDIDKSNIFGETVLFKAIKKNQPDVVLCLLNNGASLNVRNNFGWTSLHIASYIGNKEMIKIILQRGVDIDEKIEFSKGISGYTALHISFWNLHLGLCEYLLKEGSNVNATSDTGCGLWSISSYMDESKFKIAFKFLITAALNYGLVIDSEALVGAAQRGNFKLVKYCINSGVNIDIKNYYGWTALLMAAKKGDSDIVKFLLDKHADATVKTQGGLTILHLAATSGNLDLVKYLWENYDYNVFTARTASGKNILHYAAFGGRNVLEFFIDKCMNELDEQDDTGHTPLHIAVMSGKIENVSFLVNTLLDRNLRLNYTLEDGSPVFYEPHKKLYNNITDILLKAGVGCNAIVAKDEDNLNLEHVKNHDSVTVFTPLLKCGDIQKIIGRRCWVKRIRKRSNRNEN